MDDYDYNSIIYVSKDLYYPLCRVFLLFYSILAEW